jgi:hypothetical protein
MNALFIMPTAVANVASSTTRGGHEQSRPRLSQPLEYSGTLDSYTSNDLTPVIGREYYGVQVADILKSEECDRIIKDLAVMSKSENLPSMSTPSVGNRSLTVNSLQARCSLLAQPSPDPTRNAAVRREAISPCRMREF